VGIAKAIFRREVLAELDRYGIKLQKGSVIVIRGLLFRQPCEDGETAFILHECPRLVLNEVTGMIGTPIPISKAVSQHKY
jgi:hypothetical protein